VRTLAQPEATAAALLHRLSPPFFSGWSADFALPGSGGLAQLQSLWPGGSLELAVSSEQHSRLDPVTVTFNLSLAAQSSVAPLQDNASSITSYAKTLWFEGPLPWRQWGSLDALAQLQPVGAVGAAFSSVSLSLVQCSNERAEGYGANCTSPPPPPGATANASRRLAQFGAASDESCLLYLRVVRTMSQAALEIIPPRDCTGPPAGPRCAHEWQTRVLPQGCGSETAISSTAVSQEVWESDVRGGEDSEGSPEWCQDWTGAITPLPPPPLLSVRSALDPYAEAVR